MVENNAVQIVARFWCEVWQGKNPEAADHIAADDFAITSGGVLIGPRDNFKAWVGAYLESIDDFDFEVLEMFANDIGDRVVTRWVVTGRNNGFMGFEPCQTPIRMTGTSVIHVRQDGLLQHNWVERNALEVQRNLAAVGRLDSDKKAAPRDGLVHHRSGLIRQIGLDLG
jgi:hypothetical protein